MPATQRMAPSTAYGFNLRPLLARSEELAIMAQQVAAAQRKLKIVKEQITIARRDVRKLISAVVEDGVSGDWGSVEGVYIDLMGRLRSAKTLDTYEAILDELELLREEVINQLEIQINLQNSDPNDSEIRRHIQNSNTESTTELEPSSGKEQGKKPNKRLVRPAEPINTNRQ